MTSEHEGIEIDDDLAALFDQAREILGRADASDDEIVTLVLAELGDQDLAAEYDAAVARELREQANRDGVIPIDLARVERRRRMRGC